MGMEDQGWLAHFVIRALKNEPITIFGDGKQIRDLLYIDDLIDAYLLAIKNIEKVKGEVFNIGGGKENAVSILAAIGLIEGQLNKKINLKFEKVRSGDQKIFISDNTKLKKVLGFRVKTDYSQGLAKLIKWLQNQNL
jgi:CDP-paratose 2-epimerase